MVTDETRRAVRRMVEGVSRGYLDDVEISFPMTRTSPTSSGRRARPRNVAARVSGNRKRRGTPA